MSSEESSEEFDKDQVHHSVLKVKPLSWRSPQVTKLFKKMDEKTAKCKTKRGKRQTIPRVLGDTSSRPKPVSEFGPEFWGFNL